MCEANEGRQISFFGGLGDFKIERKYVLILGSLLYQQHKKTAKKSW